MKHPHITTGKHMESRTDPRFRINTAPGIMHEKGVNEAHGSFLQRYQVVELRDELNAWLDAHPTPEEQAVQIIREESSPEAAAARIVQALVGSEVRRGG